MSNYDVYWLEYPIRVWTAWVKSRSSYTKDNCEVSTLLASTCAATGGALDRLELLSDSASNPSRDVDRKEWSSARESVESFLDGAVPQDFQSEGLRVFRLAATFQGECPTGSIEEWLGQADASRREIKWKELLRHLRHSTAHCNVFTRSHERNIKDIFLLNSRSKRGDWWLCQVSVEVLVRAMQQWVEFLKTLEVGHKGVKAIDNRLVAA